MWLGGGRLRGRSQPLLLSLRVLPVPLERVAEPSVNDQRDTAIGVAR